MTTDTKIYAPGPVAKGISGNMKDLSANPLEYTAQIARDYPGIGRFRVYHKYVYIVSDPEYVKYIFKTNNSNYRKSQHYSKLKFLLGNGLITSEGDFWLRQRRLAQPIFHKQRIATFVTQMAETTQELIDQWKRTYNPADTLEIGDEMKKLALRIVGRTMLSVDLLHEASTFGEKVKSSTKFINKRQNTFVPVPVWIPTKKNRQFLADRAYMDSVIFKIIEERYKSDNNTANDLLSMLLDARDADTGERMNEQQLRDEVATIFLAGFETTAQALTWTWYALSQHPEIESKFHEELKEVLNGRTPEFEDLPKLQYTAQIIQEVMRLYPPVYNIGRENINDDTIGGYHIPKGSTFLISSYILHRAEGLWPEAEKFIPERFAPENAAHIDNDAYVPFGGGQRKCIGNHFAMMEMQIVIAMIGQHFRLRLKQGHSIIPSPAVTLVPKHGLPMHLQLR
jgi:cytochrome P450